MDKWIEKVDCLLGKKDCRDEVRMYKQITRRVGWMGGCLGFGWEYE